MAAEEEHRRWLIARLEHALQQPQAFQRLVDRLPDDNAIHGLKVWGAMHGLYPDTGGMGETPQESGGEDEHGTGAARKRASARKTPGARSAGE
jgi:hypothetical protein